MKMEDCVILRRGFRNTNSRIIRPLIDRNAVPSAE
jgi:hypothetical protein